MNERGKIPIMKKQVQTGKWEYAEKWKTGVLRMRS